MRKTPTGGKALCQLIFIAFQTDMPAQGPAQHRGLQISLPRVPEPPTGIPDSEGLSWDSRRDSAVDGGREVGNTRLCPWGGEGERAAYDLWGTHEPSEEGEMWGY